MDKNLLEFVSISNSDAETAARYLSLADGNLEVALALFFENPNLADDSADVAATAPQLPAAPVSPGREGTEANPLNVDSEHGVSDVTADEAMARRLQQEMFGEGATSEVRAPMARTRETLVGPETAWEDDGMEALGDASLASLRPPGIFNQRTTQASIWDNSGSDPSERRRELSTATGGASETSQKSNLLAEMYRPPFEMMTRLGWDETRAQGRAKEKWILVNVQDPAIFDCQLLNRDLWKNAEIKATIKESFLFLQFTKDDPVGAKYVQYYFHNSGSSGAYPHISIVDPRTGEQVKTWSGPPVPKAEEFLHQLHGFLGRYSLKANSRNPVATRQPSHSQVDVSRMTEAEMLEMAMQNSLASGPGTKDDDPDALTQEAGFYHKGKGRVAEATSDGAEGTRGQTEEPAETAFAQISSTNPHSEPPVEPSTTRIQFRSPDGHRQVRRFSTSDPVRRIYEWLKASPWEGKRGVEFELVFFGKNLIDALDSSIAEAGLNNGNINLEFAD